MDFALAYDETLGAFDLVLEGGGFRTTDALGTSIGLSLFLDARASDDDELDDGRGFAEGDPRGWWGDAFQAAGVGQYGSRLWLYLRQKLTPDTLAEIRGVFVESLDWLIERGIAREVDVEIDARPDGLVGVCVTIFRQESTPLEYAYVWDAVEGEVRG